MMDGVVVKVVSGHITPTRGSAGLMTQVPGAMTTVSDVASASGGIKPGALIETDNG